jgi:hypothetical protein
VPGSVSGSTSTTEGTEITEKEYQCFGSVHSVFSVVNIKLREYPVALQGQTAAEER